MRRATVARSLPCPFRRQRREGLLMHPEGRER